MSLRNNPLPLVTAWIGKRLSYVERLCLQSAISLGHHVILYSYNKIDNLPAGVEQRDASEILEASSFVRYANGSYALGANIFRYKLLSRHESIWIDADVFFVKNMYDNIDEDEIIIGWEDENYVNNAVLYFGESYNHNIEYMMNIIYNEPFIGPWWSKEEKDIQLENPKMLSNLPWATIGPKLVTHMIKTYNLSHKVLSSDYFYPVHWKNYQIPFDDNNLVYQYITENTIGIHLWNHMLKDFKKGIPKNKSFIAEKCRELGVFYD